VSELITSAGVPVTIARPEGVPQGAVVVLQEAFGATAYVGRVCDTLALAGFVAAAPHLYHREGDPVFGYDDLPRAREGIGHLTADGVCADVDATVAAMGLPWERTAAIGFCIGGVLAFGLATRRACAAAVTFYGGPVDVARVPGFAPMVDAVGSLRAPWLGLYGARDAMIPLASIEALGVELVEKGLHPSGYVVFDAEHGFHCDDRPAVYDVAAAQDAWDDCLDWLRQWLS
jgi:carboxymethylenebutenolidase